MEPTIRTEQENPVEQEMSLADKLQMEEIERDASLLDFANSLAGLGLEGAPDLQVLKKWKSEYGNIYMSSVTSLEEVFIWRVLYRNEWREMVNKVDMNNSFQREDYIVSRCLLYPETDTVKYKKGAGYSKSLYTSIMYQSGFVDDNTVISSIRIVE